MFEGLLQIACEIETVFTNAK